ncbi:hypothetical protein B0I73DRAFT_80731 [Yarrowia lipolytica]|uniref:Uncharacterized protein n=1 Tax=Yarrowia lipolytica TaxID=4952 RepID=A0A371C280_YARLL|nr:hypothetical protein B0I71DRAFT_85988 [Yarrowia lipolytica]RDW40474.1 hypothetical protein B0I73DRAFT_80731 [Yarrowia lipolytica]RDW47691.1 hypothetical protein B0I74DRAFT_79265 [Yarrowia lipolytica]RDW53911.1 hypothetical protein B0I75DRAFT_80432 [Yarrowia lipolytica]
MLAQRCGSLLPCQVRQKRPRLAQCMSAVLQRQRKTLIYQSGVLVSRRKLTGAASFAIDRTDSAHRPDGERPTFSPNRPRFSHQGTAGSDFKAQSEDERLWKSTKQFCREYSVSFVQ